MIYELRRIKWIKSEIKNIENILDKNNIEYKKLNSFEKRQYKINCYNNFVSSEKRNKESKYICLGNITRCTYIWNLFTYDILPTYKPTDAIKKYDELKKEDSYIIINIDGISDVAYKIINTNKLTSELCPTFGDIVVIDANFKWIFARTHEEYVENRKYYNGPYFYEKTVDKK